MENNPTTWDEGAFNAVREIASKVQEYKSPSMDVLDIVSDYISDWIAEGNTLDTDMVYAMLTQAGTEGILQINEYSTFSIIDMAKTLVSKQHDYGHDNINKFGVVGVAIRLCDKIARAKNLLARGTEANNESLHDTWCDIVGYAAISIMLRNDSFQLELAKDMQDE